MRPGYQALRDDDAGRLIDRIAMGRVIDFLNVGIGSLRTGIFNVADMAILAGVGILIVEAVRNTYTPAVSNPPSA